MGNSHETVRSVGPGATVRGTVRLGVPAPGASRVTRVKVSRVTKVPAAEAPPASGECPASGIRLTTDDGDAAMGLRVVGLHLQDCGKRDYSLDGYPLLELLDKDLAPVQGVRIVKNRRNPGGLARPQPCRLPLGQLVPRSRSCGPGCQRQRDRRTAPGARPPASASSLRLMT
ncbi:DUF4232 domain-containing protein [Streptomyces violascens]|uniref:DUF4232 domain-containing protein n=1 Tax=Streptomyces violascens TaxID=67381 RepID=UPI003648FC6B